MNPNLFYCIIWGIIGFFIGGVVSLIVVTAIIASSKDTEIDCLYNTIEETRKLLTATRVDRDLLEAHNQTLLSQIQGVRRVLEPDFSGKGETKKIPMGSWGWKQKI